MILLDRDGVLNQMVVNPDHGTIDSPLNPEQVRLMPGAAQAVARLNHWGFQTAICTNQPSAAKGKTTQANLQATHQRILDLLSAEGAVIGSSQICFHRSEDGCACRKPKPEMLVSALNASGCAKADSWMVGDGVTDIQAGRAAGVKTAFLGSKRCDVCTTLNRDDARPDLHLTSLSEFVTELGRLWGLPD